jgi:nucleotide-binding universal stress UspA family protein
VLDIHARRKSPALVAWSFRGGVKPAASEFTALLRPAPVHLKWQGGAGMWDHLLLAIDQIDSGQVALDYTTGLATKSGATVTVFHARELSNLVRVPPLETATDAQLLVNEAVGHLRGAGCRAGGRVTSVRERSVASRIVEEATHWKCDAIVLGSRRLRGMSRLSGWGVRERILRLSPLPVIVAPTPLLIGKQRAKDSTLGGDGGDKNLGAHRSRGARRTSHRL